MPPAAMPPDASAADPAAGPDPDRVPAPEPTPEPTPEPSAPPPSAAVAVPELSRSEALRRAGKRMRKYVPRKSHGRYAPAADRPDPLALLRTQDQGRVASLLPIKYGRMLASPFAFYRGAAAVMASDLEPSPSSGLVAQLCGDAHLSNFGFFASPERALVFDINDFDETAVGPWEWDLKRLAASAVIAGRELGLGDDEGHGLARRVAEAYRTTMRRASRMTALDVWYFQLEAETVLALQGRMGRSARARTKKVIAKARKRTQRHTVDRVSEVVDGRRRFTEEPPLRVRLERSPRRDLLEQGVEEAWRGYLDTVPPERRRLLERYRAIDGAFRVGGIGSVGTVCTLLLLEGERADDVIVLQQKEAGPSALAPYLDARGPEHQGQRVVQGQRLIQAASDIFLGWHRSTESGRPYYWRQLKDMKGSADLEGMGREELDAHVVTCGLCLARAHARTGHASAISGYLGKSEGFLDAIGDFALAYADQNEADYERLRRAVEAGEIEAETGV